MKHHTEPLIVAVRIINTVPTENFTQTKEFKRQDNEERLNEWRGKAMHGQYLRQMEGKDDSKTWKWLKKSNSKGSAEILICSAQEQALRANYVKFHTGNTTESPQCRMRRVQKEIVSHIGMNVRCRPKRNIERGVTMYAGIFIIEHVKNVALKEPRGGTSMGQMEVLRKKVTRFCGVSQASVIWRLKLGD